MFCIGIRAGLLQHRRIDTSSVSSFAFSCALGAHDERNAVLLCCLWLVTRALSHGLKRGWGDIRLRATHSRSDAPSFASTLTGRALAHKCVFFVPS